jgi:hypothetical protein
VTALDKRVRYPSSIRAFNSTSVKEQAIFKIAESHEASFDELKND